MNKYTKYCTAEQTKRAHKLGAPIRVDYTYDLIVGHYIGMSAEEKALALSMLEKSRIAQSYNFDLLSIPTTQQMINWLREEQKIEIVYSSGEFDVYFDVWYDNYIIAKITMDKEDCYEAELAAIDVALEYLEKGEEK